MSTSTNNNCLKPSKSTIIIKNNKTRTQMKISNFLNINSINTDLASTSKQEVIIELVDLIEKSNCLNDKTEFLNDVLARENLSTTGFGGAVAIPHAKSQAVDKVNLAIGISKTGIDFEAIDKIPAKLFFLIAVPLNSNSLHLEILSTLSSCLLDDKFTSAMMNAQSATEILNLFNNSSETKEESDEMIDFDKDVDKKNKILAVTGCPNGIAHTYLAKEALENAADKRGLAIKVETNGADGIKNELLPAEIESAHAIIVASDKAVDLMRFDGKKVLNVRVTEAVYNPDEVIERALSEDENIVKEIQFYKHLMTGIGYIVPLMVGAGIFATVVDFFEFPLPLLQISQITLASVFPVFSAFIAFSIAGTPAIAIGFVGGGFVQVYNSGFLIAIISGFIAGYLAKCIKLVLSRLPKPLDGLKTMVIYPFSGILLIGLIMYYLTQLPQISIFDNSIYAFLSSCLYGIPLLFLGAILAMMMALDMGGPINKTAYVIGIAGIFYGNYHLMASIMAGGMIPPLVTAVVAKVFKNDFNAHLQHLGRGNYLKGLLFQTEGAIEFIKYDKKRILPSCVTGAIVAGGLSAALGVTQNIPHGGIFILPLISGWYWFLFSLITGTLFGVVAYAICRAVVKEKEI